MWVAVGILACVLTLAAITFGISKLNALESRPQTQRPTLVGANKPSPTDDGAKTNKGEIFRQSKNENNRPSRVSLTGSQASSPITKSDKGPATSPKISQDAPNSVPGKNNRRNTFSLPNLVVSTPEDRTRTGQGGRSMRSLPTNLVRPKHSYRRRPNDSGELRRQVSGIGTVWGDYDEHGLFNNQSVIKKPYPSNSNSPTLKRSFAPLPRQPKSLNVSENPVQWRELDCSSQHGRTILTAQRLAASALSEMARLRVNAIEERYGNLDIQAIEEIANRTRNPLLEMRKELEVREIPLKYSGNLGDFMNLGLTLHHFSSEKNGRSISRLGLLSRERASQLGAVSTFVSSTSSRNSDTRLGLDHFVHLSFTSTPAMRGSILLESRGNLIDYRISPLVLDNNATMYCRNYANKRGAEWIPFNQLTALDLISLFLGFSRIGYWQALVKQEIPPHQVRQDTALMTMKAGF